MDKTTTIQQMKMAIVKGDDKGLSEVVATLRKKARFTPEQIAVMERVKNGKIWLNANPNHSNFEKNLKLYESLVDKLRAMGISEYDVDMLDDTGKFESLFDSEMEEVN